MDHFCRVVAFAENRDNISSIHLVSGLTLEFYEKNFTLYTLGKRMWIEFVVRDRNEYRFGSNLDSSVVIANFSQWILPSLEVEQPKSQNLSFGSESRVLLKAVTTFRCARGYEGHWCEVSCDANANASEPIYSPVSAFSGACWPRSHYVCSSGAVGPSCVLRRFCSKLRCANNQCAMLRSGNAATCKLRSANACKNGEEACSRRGVCRTGGDSLTAKCDCAGEFGGEHCEFGDWCSSLWKCEANGTCTYDSALDVYSCYCNFTGRFCHTREPCGLANCWDYEECLYRHDTQAFKCIVRKYVC